MQDALTLLKGRLIVSCQAYPGEPMLDPRTMTQIAQAAIAGGAAGIRAKGLTHLTMMRSHLTVPIIGLVKKGTCGVFITPTLEDCLDVASTGCEVVALDGTRRRRPDGLSLSQTITRLKEAHPEVLVMADCGSLEDARSAEQSGADLVGTTLSGYTGERPSEAGPDHALVGEMAASCGVPVVAEGRIRDPAEAVRALDAGAWCVVVGTAITHPTSITSRFATAMQDATWGISSPS